MKVHKVVPARIQFRPYKYLPLGQNPMGQTLAARLFGGTLERWSQRVQGKAALKLPPVTAMLGLGIKEVMGGSNFQNFCCPPPISEPYVCRASISGRTSAGEHLSESLDYQHGTLGQSRKSLLAPVSSTTVSFIQLGKACASLAADCFFNAILPRAN